MPYLKPDIKKLLDLDIMQAKNHGDYNYLFTIAYLKEFFKEPRYNTIAEIKIGSIHPLQLESINKVEMALIELGVTLIDRQVARELAFLEFYRRVGVHYEEFAVEKNGDLKEYEKAEELVEELRDLYYEGIQ